MSFLGLFGLHGSMGFVTNINCVINPREEVKIIKFLDINVLLGKKLQPSMAFRGVDGPLPKWGQILHYIKSYILKC